MNRRGYTFPELILTVTVIGTLASISFPSINETRERMALRSATAEFITAHSLARAAAMQYGRVSRLVIDASGARFWVEIDTTTAATGTLTRIGPTHDLSDGQVTMTSSSSLLCLDARGIASSKDACPSGAALVRFIHGATMSQIGVTALGKVIH